MRAKLVKYNIENNRDFINIKRFNYSLEKLLDKYPEGVPDRLICQALDMSLEEVNELYANVLLKLKSKLEPNEI